MLFALRLQFSSLLCADDINRKAKYKVFRLVLITPSLNNTTQHNSFHDDAMCCVEELKFTFYIHAIIHPRSAHIRQRRRLPSFIFYILIKYRVVCAEKKKARVATFGGGKRQNRIIKQTRRRLDSSVLMKFGMMIKT